MDDETRNVIEINERMFVNLEKIAKIIYDVHRTGAVEPETLRMDALELLSRLVDLEAGIAFMEKYPAIPVDRDSLKLRLKAIETIGANALKDAEDAIFKAEPVTKSYN